MTFIRWNELTKLDESRWNCIFALASCWKSKIYIIWCLQKVLCVGDNKWRPSVAVFVLKCVSWRPPGSPPPVWRVASGLPTSVPRAGCSELGVARRTLIVLTSANYSLELAQSIQQQLLQNVSVVVQRVRRGQGEEEGGGRSIIVYMMVTLAQMFLSLILQTALNYLQYPLNCYNNP